MHAVPPIKFNMAARSLDAYLNAAGALSRLSAHGGRLVRMQRVFEKIAPDHLATSSRVANFRLGKVVIHADSGAVAAKLRQMLPGLLDKFSLEGVEITEIQVKVQPVHAATQQKSRGPAPLLATSARSDLEGLAAKLPADSPLKQALLRLLRRSR